MKTYDITITLQMQIDPDMIDIEVAVVDEFFTNPEAFDYKVETVEVEDEDEDADGEEGMSFERALWISTGPNLRRSGYVRELPAWD